MADERLKTWETLFERALVLIDDARGHRGAEFTARDLFDLAMVAEMDSKALHEIRPQLRERRDVVLAWVERREPLLRETFDALAVLDYRRSFDHCVKIVRDALSNASS